jgi:hypothetical protein
MHLWVEFWLVLSYLILRFLCHNYGLSLLVSVTVLMLIFDCMRMDLLILDFMWACCLRLTVARTKVISPQIPWATVLFIVSLLGPFRLCDTSRISYGRLVISTLALIWLAPVVLTLLLCSLSMLRLPFELILDGLFLFLLLSCKFWSLWEQSVSKHLHVVFCALWLRQLCRDNIHLLSAHFLTPVPSDRFLQGHIRDEILDKYLLLLTKWTTLRPNQITSDARETARFLTAWCQGGLS